MGQAVRFYTDEHVATAVVKALRHHGVDVMTVSDAGMLGAIDEKDLSIRRQRDSRSIVIWR